MIPIEEPGEAGSATATHRKARRLWLAAPFVLVALGVAGYVALRKPQAEAVEPPRDVPTFDGQWIRYSQAFAGRAGLEFAPAETGSLAPVVNVTGTVDFDPERVAVIRDRPDGAWRATATVDDGGAPRARCRQAARLVLTFAVSVAAWRRSAPTKGRSCSRRSTAGTRCSIGRAMSSAQVGLRETDRIESRVMATMARPTPRRTSRKMTDKQDSDACGCVGVVRRGRRRGRPACCRPPGHLA